MGNTMNIRVVIVLLVCCVVLLAGYTAVMAFVAENALPPLIESWLDWLLNDVLGAGGWETQQRSPSD